MCSVTQNVRGTQALKIDYVVPAQEKHARSQCLLELSDEKTKAFYARHIGAEAEVLMEKSKAGTPMHGFTKKLHSGGTGAR